VRDLLASAWLTITRHRLRSLLAMAGVAVGVCALTSIMSVENSWQREVTRFFAAMDLRTVRVEHPGGWQWRRLGYRRAELNAEDARAIEEQCRAAEAATFVVTWPSLLVEHEGYGLESPVRAVEPNFCQALPDKAREGRLISAGDIASRAPVCVVSLKTRLFLFGDEPAIGKRLRVAGHPFEVIGVITGQGHFGIGDEGIYVPASWARTLGSRAGRRAPYQEIYVRTHDPKAVSARIDQLLRSRVGGGESAGFTNSLWQVREAALHSRSRATFYSGLAALCALLAAGVGIAALLFVSVSERSRDIGIMRALGASRLWVYGEHVVTALLLTAAGAVLGIVAGIPASTAGAFAIRWQPLLPAQMSLLGHRVAEFPKLSQLAVTISWQAVIVSVALAVLTGVLAALAPASEAAQVNPAQAIAQRPGGRGRLREVLTCLQVGFGVLVLVVLTSYFTVLQNEERVEARRRLGEDRLAAVADPIGAMHAPVDDRYLQACTDSLADVLASPKKLAALRARTPLVKDLTPVVPTFFDVTCGGRTAEASQIVFTTGDVLSYGQELSQGDRAQIEEAFAAGAAVAVVDTWLTEALFGARSPLGRTLRIGGRAFTIVGVRGNRDFHQNGGAWVPISFYSELKHRARRDELVRFSARMTETRVDSRPRDERQYAAAMAQVRDALLPLLPPEYRRSILLSERVPATLREFIFQRQAVAVRGAVGALAVLLVGLIGLANMLLVSVHDQMREVGLRRALGALRADVFWHFLSQGVLLSGLGAGAGLGLGALICWATRTWSGTPLAVSAFWAAAGAVATLLAGTHTAAVPAAIGARVHPVEALRYE
jgi:putative ABC transport system permease protein